MDAGGNQPDKFGISVEDQYEQNQINTGLKEQHIVKF